jgi:hypothetical protein
MLKFVTKKQQSKIEIFKRVNYIVDNKFTLKINENSEAAKLLLKKYNAEHGVFVTPCNPNSLKVSKKINKSRLRNFETILKTNDVVYFRGVGVCPHTKWKEQSFFILNPIKVIDKHIESIGQDAYVSVNSDGFTTLMISTENKYVDFRKL